MSKKNFLSDETQREAAFLAHDLMHATSNEERSRIFARLMETLEVTPEAQADGAELFAAVAIHRRRKRMTALRQSARPRQMEVRS